MIRRLCLSVIALSLFAVVAPQDSAEAQSLIVGRRGIHYNGYGRGYYGGYRAGYYNAYGNGPYGYGYSNGYQYPNNTAYGYGYSPYYNGYGNSGYYNGYGNAGYYGNSYAPSSNPLGYGVLNSFGIGW